MDTQKFKVKITDKILPGAQAVSCQLASGGRLSFSRGKKAVRECEIELPLDVAQGLARDGYELTPNPLAPAAKPKTKTE